MLASFLFKKNVYCVSTLIPVLFQFDFLLSVLKYDQYSICYYVWYENFSFRLLQWVTMTKRFRCDRYLSPQLHTLSFHSSLTVPPTMVLHLLVIQTRLLPTSGHLHFLFFLPLIFSSQLFAWLAPSHFSDLSSAATSSELWLTSVTEVAVFSHTILLLFYILHSTYYCFIYLMHFQCLSLYIRNP